MSDSTSDEKKPEPGTGHTHQAFLVGDNIYLRPIQEDDAEYAVSWRQDPYPRSVSAIKSLIEDDLKDEEGLHLIIVRKSDDRPVGSIDRDTWAHNTWLRWRIDPLFGEQGQHWVAEAFGLVVPWMIEEQHRIVIDTEVADDQPIVMRAMQELGGRIAATHTGFVRRGERYIDGHMVAFLNPQWVATLGDPFEEEKPRSGTGEPRPVVAPVQVAPEDVPENAIRIGPRVYLRPLQKEDAEVASRWHRKETEPFWSGGRFTTTITSLEKWHTELSEGKHPDEIVFAVCLRENGTYIGLVGVDGIDWVNRNGESLSEFHDLGYRGAGYGSEAKHLLFDYVFNTLGLHSLQSWVMYGNTRSAAALRKQGYKDRGIEPWLVRRDGAFESFGTYELLADEWRAMPRASYTEGDSNG